ncbi:MAG: ECF transporter S component, partial [Eubacteriales bacterium]
MIVIKNERLRRILRFAVPLAAIPAVVAAGVFAFGESSYAFISLAVTILALVLFISGFERRKTGTRRLIIVAAMTALSAAGRFIPFFKPVTAITVITGMYLGSEAGFLTGALSAVISNF